MKVIILDIFDKFFINSVTDDVLYPDKIAVALSGGCDSMALTLLMNDWAINHSIQLTTLIVDHKLRPESTEEVNIVKSKMNSLGIDSKILTYTGVIPKSNIEEIARNYRYDLIINYCMQNNIKYVATAHNKDEQCETFLLNLIRGSGLYGLCGIPEVIKKQDITFIRPVLCYEKDELRNICKNYNQTWIEDPSNEDEKYLRVKIRKLKNIFNDLGLTTDRICKTIDNMKSIRQVIDPLIYDKFNECLVNKFDKLKIMELDLQILLSSSNEIVYRILNKCITDLVDIQNNHVRSDTFCKIIDDLKLSLKTGIFNDRIASNIKFKLINRDNKCILQLSEV